MRGLRRGFVAIISALAATASAAPRAAPEPGPAQVAFRPGDALPTLGPEARVDRGLRAAAEALAAAATSADARLTPAATRLALAHAGYPGDAHFVAARDAGSAPPIALLEALPRGVPVDVGWASRDLPNGGRFWVVGWAIRGVSLDPVPRDLTPGQGIALRVDGVAHPRLLVGRPNGRVDELDLTSGVARWARFAAPGEHRVEVIDGDHVELLFSLFVGASPPALPPLPGTAPTPDPAADLPFLYEALDRLRGGAGLPPLTRFPDFEPHARAHGACLASAGVVAHATPSCPGVPVLARGTHFPRARHTENVATGDTAEEAWERVLASPGHLQNLLCTACTHVAIGATLESASIAPISPCMFLVWELLELPEGPPLPIPNR
ncbi:MAG: CAP domain-containing protein [Pseudomonadota bacterium]|nr:CAP domain-containing protein [Pseudomonadota bacterium]